MMRERRALNRGRLRALVNISAICSDLHEAANLLQSHRSLGDGLAYTVASDIGGAGPLPGAVVCVIDGTLVVHVDGRFMILHAW